MIFEVLLRGPLIKARTRGFIASLPSLLLFLLRQRPFSAGLHRASLGTDLFLLRANHAAKLGAIRSGRVRRGSVIMPTELLVHLSRAVLLSVHFNAIRAFAPSERASSRAAFPYCLGDPEIVLNETDVPFDLVMPLLLKETWTWLSLAVK